MYIAPGQGQTVPRGKNFDVNRTVLSLYPFVAKFKEISLKSDFIQFFPRFNTRIYPRVRGHTAPRGQSFDVNRNFLSLHSFVASFKSQTTIVFEKSIVLLFPIQKHKGPNLTLP